MPSVSRPHGGVRARRVAESGGVANVGKFYGGGKTGGKNAEIRSTTGSLSFLVFTVFNVQ